MDIKEEFAYILAAELQSYVPASYNFSLSDIEISTMPDGFTVYLSGGLGKLLIHDDDIINTCIDNAIQTICASRNINMERKDD